MSTIGNATRRQLPLHLEARKSFAFGLRFHDRRTDGPVDLTDASLHLVVQQPAHLGGATVIDIEPQYLDRPLGVTQFLLQASDLDLAEGEYPYSITLLTSLGYSRVVAKGDLVIYGNTGSAGLNEDYPGVSPSTNLIAYLAHGDTVVLDVDGIDGMTSIVTQLISSAMGDLQTLVADFTNETTDLIADFQADVVARVNEALAAGAAAEAAALAAGASAAEAAAAAAQAADIILTTTDEAMTSVVNNSSSTFLAALTQLVTEGALTDAELAALVNDDESALTVAILDRVGDLEVSDAELAALVEDDGSQLSGAIDARIPDHTGGRIELPPPTGVAATDNAALAAAIVAAGTKGLIEARPGTYAISGHHIIGSGVDLRGCGGGSTSMTSTTRFLCTTANSRIEFASGGGLSGYFEIDGDSVATTPFARTGGLGANARSFHNLTVRKNAAGANDLCWFYGAQNDLFIQCGFADGARDLAWFDKGFGGAAFIRCQWRSAGRYHHRYDDELPVEGPVYPWPSDIKHITGICEGTSGTSIIFAGAAGNISYNDQPLYTYNNSAGPLVDLQAGAFSFQNPFLQSTPSTVHVGSRGIRVSGSASATLIGRAQYQNLECALTVTGGLLCFIYDHTTAFPYQTPTLREATAGAGLGQITQLLSSGSSYHLSVAGDYIITSTNYGRNAFRFGIRSGGRMDWNSGVGYTHDVSIDRRAAGAVGVVLPQSVLCTGAGTTAQRPAAAAALAGALYVNTDTDSIDSCDGVTWHAIQNNVWINAVTSGITTNPVGTFAPIGYTIAQDRRVTLRGMGGTVGIGAGVLFTLPEGMRPEYPLWAPIVTLTGASVLTPGYIQILANGNVSVPAGAGGFVSFDGVSFIAAPA